MENSQSDIQKLYLSSLKRRFVARIFDGILLQVILVPLNANGIFSIIYTSALGATVSGMLVSTVVGALFEIVFLTQRGQTPGKIILGIKVVGEDAQPITLNQAVLRYITMIIPLESLWALFNIKKQAVHDIVAKTVVININKGDTHGTVA